MLVGNLWTVVFLRGLSPALLAMTKDVIAWAKARGGKGL
jgi:hypothetical protein